MANLQVSRIFKKNWAAINEILPGSISEKNPNGIRKYRYIINKGSSRSSKTYSLIDLYDSYARSNDDKRMTVWRNTKKDCKDTVLKDMTKHLKFTNRYGWAQLFNKTESTFTYATGSTIELGGTEDVDTVMGLTQDVAWFNEPYKISKEIFDQIDQRTSEFIIIDLNPKISHWVDDLEKDSRALVITSTFRDNPFVPLESKIKILSYQPVSWCEVVLGGLIKGAEAKVYDLNENELKFTEKQIKQLRRCRENEDKKSANAFNWQVFGLGIKAEKPHRIFHFEEISDEKYLQIDVTRYVAVDWGKRDPWAILEAKYYDGALYLKELNYASEDIIKAQLKPTELAQITTGEEGLVTFHFNRLGVDKNTEIICDPNRIEKIAALRGAGFIRAVAASKPSGSINFGIETLDAMPVYYTRSSINLKYEQENYSRKVDRYGVVLDEPEDTDNHLCDCARYVAFHLRRLGIIKKV